MLNKMTTNYFNTSSSFIMSIGSQNNNNSPQRIYIEQLQQQSSQHHTIIQSKTYQQNLYEDQQQYQNNQYKSNNKNEQYMNYQIEDIYQGITNIQRFKILRIITQILNNKIYFYKLLLFRKLTFKPKLYQKKKIRNNLLFRHVFNFYNVLQDQLKYFAFEKLKKFFQYDATKEIGLLQVIVRNKMRINYNLKKALNILRQNAQFYNSKNPKINKFHANRNVQYVYYSPPSQIPLQTSKIKTTRTQHSQYDKFQKLRNQFGPKLLNIFLKNKLKQYFNDIKYKKLRKYSGKSKKYQNKNQSLSKNNSNSNGTNNNSGIINSYKNKFVNATVYKSSNNKMLQIQSVLTMKKMPKTKHKSAEYVIIKNNIGKICNLTEALKIIIRKHYKYGLLKIKHKISNTKPIIKNQQEQQIDNKQDNPQIYTNILKHLCWISSKQSSKQSKTNQKKFQEYRNIKLNQFFLFLQRKYKNNLKFVFRRWNNRFILSKLQILQDIRRLEDLKEKYIESYK